MNCEHCHGACSDNHCKQENHTFMIIRLILGFVLIVSGYFFKLTPLFTASYLLLGYDVIITALKNITHLLGEHFLMTAATIGAMAIGEFPEAAAVMLFYQIGELLSDIAVDKSKESIGKLLDLRSDTATVIKDGTPQEMHSEDVQIGDIIRVASGEKIPLDGKIISGNAYLDTKSLTGEAVFKHFTVGDTVLSGMICTDSVIDIEVTKKYEDSTASKILEMTSAEKASNSEKFITKFARIYTPIVVVLAILITLIPTLFGGSFKDWFYRSMLFLVVSCPCALVVSVPLSFFAGIGCASKNGILIKGAFSLEEASKTSLVAFDKTGTLTEGSFEVQSVRSGKLPKYFILKYAAYCEKYSSHPIAKAIVSAFSEAIDTSLISDFKEIAGMGVSAMVEGHNIMVGGRSFIADAPDIEKAVFVAINGEYAGYIEIFDKVKPTSSTVFKKLHDMGIKTVILTGDTVENAENFSKKLQSEFFAGLLPQDKLSKINQFKENENVAFVGDGINDAPALTAANLGVSMGSVGSDAAISASDAVIVSDNPDKMIDLIKISKKTMKIVRQNIVFTISVKILMLILGALGFASMWLAVFSDVGVCLLAILNSVRAFSVKY